ncbi:MAG: tRNA (N6-threonylcarbamoyladenosine(37)-N6)-methyltransferase TrmO [Gammaproteobacteria bacterium]|nr:tRNA (N6-threonylcarbamoyladenosine(37)-N6)-methyltransferase TrmO [Gammaproteobacteria bacterium]MCP4881249.1 tRNA (N6-threonylcarbamoyladenosine(37)-N6)-methyltransferase TrmO [Gammaproteobacteria bacterium]
MSNSDHVISLKPIAYIESDFKEKFATPRQPGLVPAAQGRVVLQAPFNQADAVQGLEEFSHIWLIFGFHATAQQGWKPKVRPPRLGGNAKLGVFATRSTFRPNPLGLSLVRLKKVSTQKEICLHVEGADLIHGTPVYDIKPYLPWVESQPYALSGFAVDDQTIDLPIQYAPQAVAALANESSLQTLIEQVLRHDPRPAYQQDPQRVYGCHLQNVNVQWQVLADHILVNSITPA